MQPYALLIFSVMHAKLLQSCPTLCDPMNCSLPGSSVHGTLQARILEWVAMPSSKGSFQPVSLMFPALAGRYCTTCATWETLFNHSYAIFIFKKSTKLISLLSKEKKLKIFKSWETTFQTKLQIFCSYARANRISDNQ